MKEAIRNKQIIFIVFASIVGFSAFSLPKRLGLYAGTGGWVIAIINAIISIPLLIIIAWLNKQYEKKALFEYLEDITGKYLSIFIMIAFLIRYIASTLLVTLSLISEIRLTILAKTPLWALGLTFIICCGYGASKGINSLSYIYEFFALILFFLVSFLLIAMFSKSQFVNLRPLFVKEDIPIYLKESFRNLVVFAGFDKLFFVPLFKKENKKINSFLILAIISIALLYIMIFWATIAVSNINEAVLYNDIFLLAVRSVELENLDILKRLDGLAIANFTFSGLMATSLNLYAASAILSHYLKSLKFKATSLNFSAGFLCLVSFLLCITAPGLFHSERYIQFTSIASVITSFVIPIILFMIVKVKIYVKKKS